MIDKETLKVYRQIDELRKERTQKASFRESLDSAVGNSVETVSKCGVSGRIE